MQLYIKEYNTEELEKNSIFNYNIEEKEKELNDLDESLSKENDDNKKQEIEGKIKELKIKLENKNILVLSLKTKIIPCIVIKT